jgi:hypothetical protein
MTNHTTPITGGTPLPGHPHGRLSTYTWHGCRCPDCTRTATTWSAAKRRQQAYGRWQPLSDASRARAHLLALQGAGLTRQQITDKTGVHAAVLRNLAAGTTRRIRPANAAALLALPAPAQSIASRIRVDGTATRRRLQALAVAGWPLPQIARRANVDGHNLHRVVHGRRTKVAAHTAAAIHAVYGQLWDQDPADHGVPERHVSTVQRLAARNLWAPPLAWDDDTINDPAAEPDWTGRCGTPGGYYDHTQIGTPTCRRCRTAVAQAAAERKARRRARAA